jgi:hypothetical protein
VNKIDCFPEKVLGILGDKIDEEVFRLVGPIIVDRRLIIVMVNIVNSLGKPPLRANVIDDRFYHLRKLVEITHQSRINITC